MAGYLRAIREESDATEGPIRFTASTEGVKRDGKDLKLTNWNLDNYRRNPVVLWSHDYAGRTLPIGRSQVQLAENSLMTEITFDPEDEFARQVESKYRRGFLSAVSVGWDTEGMVEGQERYELLDISAVPVPGDPDALMERQRRALSKLGQELLNELEPEIDDLNTIAGMVITSNGDTYTAPIESGQAVWRGVATAMGDLLQVKAGEMDEEHRRKIYNDLEKLYRRLGRTPPEYMTAEQLTKLGDDEIRGLLLEQEPYDSGVVRVGPEVLDAVSAVIAVATDLEAKLRGIAEPDVDDDEIKRQEEMAWRLLEAMGGNDDSE